MKTTVFLAKVCVYLLGLSGRFGKILGDLQFLNFDENYFLKNFQGNV
jgi:hypothetical protein